MKNPTDDSGGPYVEDDIPIANWWTAHNYHDEFFEQFGDESLMGVEGI